jgi:hypothetical protein
MPNNESIEQSIPTDKGREMEVNGIKYEIVGIKTFRHNGVAREEITMKRKNGRRIYTVVRYENGTLSSVV